VRHEVEGLPTSAGSGARVRNPAAKQASASSQMASRTCVEVLTMRLKVSLLCSFQMI